MRVPCRQPVYIWKKRILAHCGLSPDRSLDFGLTLGFAVLNEERSSEGNDLCQGDTVTLFERASSIQQREAALANLN